MISDSGSGGKYALVISLAFFGRMKKRHRRPRVEGMATGKDMVPEIRFLRNIVLNRGDVFMNTCTDSSTSLSNM